VSSLASTFPNSERKPQTVRDLVQFGARHEDRIKPDHRSVHHFFDPHRNRPLTWPLIGTLGEKSPDWIIDGMGQSGEEFSYRRASDHFYYALTAATPIEREHRWGQVFQNLGHVIHHIQDMAQPQHVRNDPHLDISDLSIPMQLLASPFKDPSWYEHYTDRHRAKWLPLLDHPVSPVTLPNVRSYWSRSDGKGMADFTNGNFVSKGSNFSMQSGQPAANSEYSSPAPVAGGEVRTLTELGLEGAEALCARLKDNPRFIAPPGVHCQVEFVASNVIDRYTGQSSLNRRASSISIFDQYLKAVSGTVILRGSDGTEIVIDRLFTLNEFNFDAAHEYLIPRAVAYSAGLINHFFRGRIELARVTGGSGWLITNIGNLPMSGTFSIHHENSAGQRAPVPGGSWTGTVAKGAAVPMTFPEPPTGTSKLVAVFNGQLGTGEPQMHVAGKVADYVPPPKKDVYITIGDNGGELDDAFDLYVNGTRVYKGGVVLTSGPIKVPNLTVGNHALQVVRTNGSNVGTYYLSIGDVFKSGTRNALVANPVGSISGSTGTTLDTNLRVLEQDETDTIQVVFGDRSDTASCRYNFHMNGQLVSSSVESSPAKTPPTTAVRVGKSGFYFFNLMNGVVVQNPWGQCTITFYCPNCGLYPNPPSGSVVRYVINFQKPDFGLVFANGGSSPMAGSASTTSTSQSLTNLPDEASLPANAFKVLPDLPASP
jgi:hypothetical protein